MITVPLLSQLQYAIFDSHPSLEPLRIMREQSIAWGSWQVTFYILGASHAVRFSRGNEAFTEILACLPPHTSCFGDSTKLFEIEHVADTAAAAPHGRLQAGAGLVYGLSHKVEVKCLQLEDDRLIDEYGKSEITHIFPADQRLAMPDPVTRVGWDALKSTLTIETLHYDPIGQPRPRICGNIEVQRPMGRRTL